MVKIVVKTDLREKKRKISGHIYGHLFIFDIKSQDRSRKLFFKTQF
jgi:hypothetical protein